MNINRWPNNQGDIGLGMRLQTAADIDESQQTSGQAPDDSRRAHEPPWTATSDQLEYTEGDDNPYIWTTTRG